MTPTSSTTSSYSTGSNIASSQLERSALEPSAPKSSAVVETSEPLDLDRDSALNKITPDAIASQNTTHRTRPNPLHLSKPSGGYYLSPGIFILKSVPGRLNISLAKIELYNYIDKQFDPIHRPPLHAIIEETYTELEDTIAQSNAPLETIEKVRRDLLNYLVSSPLRDLINYPWKHENDDYPKPIIKI